MTTKIGMLLAAVGSFFTMQAQAQHHASTQYRYNDAVQLWNLTDNAAGLGVDSLHQRGIASVTFQHDKNTLKRAQEEGMNNQLTAYTERYQNIGQYLVGYGSFSFNMQHQKDKTWSDVYRSYNSNPFIVGSDVAGVYDLQNIALKARLATVHLGALHYGLGIDYEVGDLSRLRDPRSRANLLIYQFTPSAVYAWDKDALGVSLYYKRRKEKIPNVQTVRSDANLTYYIMSGLDNVLGVVNGHSSLNREWVNHTIGANLQYAHHTSSWHSLNNIGIEKAAENVYGQYKYEPGKYYAYTYNIGSFNRIYTANAVQQVDVKAQYTQGYADEYRQQLVQENNASTGVTSQYYTTLLTYKKRYQVRLFDVDLTYRYNLLGNGNEIVGYVGAAGHYLHAANKHLLPHSHLRYGIANAQLQGGYALLKNRQLWLEGAIGSRWGSNSLLELADANSKYAQEVLQKDMDYYNSKGLTLSGSVTYHFPLMIKGNNTSCFVKAYGYYEAGSNKLSRNTIGVSLGVIY